MGSLILLVGEKAIVLLVGYIAVLLVGGLHTFHRISGGLSLYFWWVTHISSSGGLIVVLLVGYRCTSGGLFKFHRTSGGLSSYFWWDIVVLLVGYRFTLCAISPLFVAGRGGHERSRFGVSKRRPG